MSAEEVKAAIGQAIAGFNDPANRETYLGLYTDAAVYHGVGSGIEAIRGFYDTLWSAFPDARLEIEDVVVEGDKVAGRYVMKATHQGPFQGIPATGKQITLAGITILRLVNGRCVERWNQADLLGLMQQLGVAPAPA
jgi:steroid delta-isomerase-like uncharacterized protein